MDLPYINEINDKNDKNEMNGVNQEIYQDKYQDRMERIKYSVQDFLFPDSIYCVCCGNLIDKTRSYSLCDHCMTHIRWNLDEPRIVKTKHLDGFGNEVEDEIRMIRCTKYGIYERSIIFALKYDGHMYISRVIAEIMKDRILAGGDFDPEMIIVPVPLHRFREIKRGYNQAELIAKHLSKELRLPMTDILLRSRATRPMKGLGPEERDANIYGSMEVNPRVLRKCEAKYADIKEKNVLIVDDFFTTGSTARECTRALREAGFIGKVTMLAFAAR